MTDTATATPAPAEQTTTTTTATDATPSAQPADDREAEYRAALAKARGEEPKTPAAPKVETAPKTEAAPVENPNDSEGENNKEINANDSEVFKLKVNGEEIEVKSREEIVRLAQLGMASNKKFEEAAKMRKDAEGFIERLKSDPISVLTHPSLGINFQELAEQFVYDTIQQAQLSPAERELRATKAELARLKAAEDARRQQEEQAQHTALAEKARADLSVKFQAALEEGGVPRTDWTVSRMATYMREALRAGQQIEPKDVLPLVKRDFIQAQKQFYEQMAPDQMIEVLGKETVDKIRQHQVAQYKAQQAAPVKTNAPAPQTQRRQFSSVEEMREALSRG